MVVLDSAGYGAFSIGQAVSIIAPPGVYGGISVFSGDGIDINAGGSDTVILRGLTVNNQGGNNGIVFNTGGTLHIENCVVNGFSFSGKGVFFKGAGTLEVKDSIMRGSGAGISVAPSSGTAVATIDQVRLEGCQFGLDVEAGSNVTVRNSIACRNANGFFANSVAAAAAELNLANCVASNNSQGIHAGRGSTGAVIVRVSDSTVTDNSTGLVITGTGASLLSRGNNTVEGNGTDGIFNGTYSAK